MKSGKLIYLHIPKTAGSSFREVIANNGFEYQSFPGIRAAFLEKEKENSVTGGHMPYGIHWLRNYTNCRYITILRDPVERCISHYYFVKEWNKHPLFAKAQALDIVDFYRLPMVQNLQVQYLGGDIFRRGRFVPPSRRTLLRAMRRSMRMIVGFVEYYEQSVGEICQTLGWKPYPIVLTRGAKMRPHRGQLDENVVKDLASLNELDYKLYRYCLERATWLDRSA